MKLRLIFCFFLFLSSKAVAEGDRWGGYVSGAVGLGQMGNAAADLGQRTMFSGSVDSLLGVNVSGFTAGIHADLQMVGQVTPIARADGTNLGGRGYSLGLGARYFFSPQWYGFFGYDFLSPYKFNEQTHAGEDDDLRRPRILRLKIGKRLDFERHLLTADLDLRHAHYDVFHIAGVDRDWKTELWSLGVALTWHFGPAERSVAAKAEEAASIPAPPAPATRERERRVPSMFVFEAYSSRLTAEMENELRRIAAIFREEGFDRLEIEGHSDVSGRAGRNSDLARERAAAASRFLVKEGVPAERISLKNLSSTAPAGDNATKEGRAKSRRYEIILKRD